MITRHLYRKRFGKVRSRVFSRKRFPAGSRYLRIRYPLGCLIDTAFKTRNFYLRAGDDFWVELTFKV